MNDTIQKPKKKPSARHRARVFAMQALYEWRVANTDEAALRAHFSEKEGFANSDTAFFTLLLKGVLKESEALQAAMAEHLDRAFSELSPVEAAILLLGSFELIHCPETPHRVILNEAIELAKTFGGTDGHKYVNGVLDKLSAKYRALELRR